MGAYLDRCREWWGEDRTWTGVRSNGGLPGQMYEVVGGGGEDPYLDRCMERWGRVLPGQV